MSANEKRRRRTAEEARDEILDAAEALVRDVGPSALRLQEVAARVGMSHPTVLHHVGSKEELLQAVATRGLQRLTVDLLGELAEGPAGTTLSERIERAVALIDGRGHPRLLAWLSLADRIPAERPSFAPLVAAAHAARSCRAPGACADVRDTQYQLVLVGLALLGDAVTGDVLYEDVGFEDVAAARQGFRRWLVRLLLEHVGDASTVT